MSEKNDIADAVRDHGNQLGNNLVFLKKFLAAQNEQHKAIQEEANSAAKFAAIAAGLVALASTAQVVVLLLKP